MYLGQVLGVSLKVHYLFLFWLLISATLGDWIFTVVLVVSVCFHELGHILAALNCRVGVDEVVLMPFGSVAKLRRWLGVEPKTEAAIALAGPANSLVLCVVGLLYQYTTWGQSLLEANILLFSVNLLPVLPLDGGRVIRSLVIRSLGFGTKGRHLIELMEKTAWVFMGIVGVLYLLGVLSINAIVLALFLLYATVQERKMMPYLFVRYLGGKPGELAAAGVLVGRVIVVLPDTPVANALPDMTPRCYHLFHVVQPTGGVITITEEALFAALIRHGPDITFADVESQ